MSLSQGEFLNLWPSEAPGALGGTEEDIPAMQVILPTQERATGAAIIVCPGGGYRMRADHEGAPVGEWLATLGITAFVLRYRVGPAYQYPTQLGDAQRALRFVRAHAKEWQLDPERLGILGFSAGGHLVSMTATRFTDDNANDELGYVSARPTLQILIYLVISLSVTYQPIDSLLGNVPLPSSELVEELSSDKHITPQTPPAFLVHSTEDSLVVVENSDRYAAALKEKGVPFEYVRGAMGEHGSGLLASWTEPCAAWLRKMHFAQ